MADQKLKVQALIETLRQDRRLLGTVVVATVLFLVLVGGSLFSVWLSAHKNAALQQELGLGMIWPEPLKFSLQSFGGKSYDEDSFGDKFLLIFAAPSSCRDACSASLAALAGVEKRLEVLGTQIQPLYILLDSPEADLSQHQQFLETYYPHIIGLTGTAQQVADVTKFLTLTSVANAEYPFYLVDKKGRLVVALPQTTGLGVLTSTVQSEIRKRAQVVE